MARVDAHREPAPRPLHGIRPAGTLGGSTRGRHGRLEPGSDSDQSRELGIVRPEADGATGQQGRPEGRRLGDGGPLDGPAEQVRLDLEQQVVGRGAAVGPQRRQVRGAAALERLDQVDDLVCDGLERGAREMGAGRACGHARDGATRVGIPVRSSETGECRHEHDAGGVGHGGRQGLDVAGGPDDAQAISQPAHGRPGHEDAALDGVGDIGAAGAGSLALPGDRGQQAGRRLGRRGARRLEQEAAGAVRVLGVAGRQAQLAEERRLLVADRGRDGDRGAEVGRLGHPEARVGGADLGQRGSGDPEELELLRRPGPRAEIQEQRPAGVADVGGEGPTAGQSVDEPGVDGPQPDRADLRPCAVHRPGDRAARPSWWR